MGHDKTAFVSGITGQDGSYLTELLLAKGYSAVHGLCRRTSITARPRIDHLQAEPGLHLHYGDVLDGGCLHRLLGEIQPDEIYHLAAQSQVHVSFGMPEYTGEVDYLGTQRMLEAFRQCCPQARFYNAASSEMFGSSPPPQDENTPFRPCSPYGIAKLASYWLCRNYRDAYGLWVANGILFNHESPRRGESFVSRKITRGVVRIAIGKDDVIRLGNLSAIRDWGHARDYVLAMWMILQSESPEDWVVATGRHETVRGFIAAAANEVGLHFQPDAPFNGTSGCLEFPFIVDGQKIYAHSATKHVVVDPAYFRPLEVNALLGNSSKIRSRLGWEPQITFEQLVTEMVKEDLRIEGGEQAEIARLRHELAAATGRDRLPG